MVMFFPLSAIYNTRIFLSKVAIDKLEPGMKLSKPVENSSGMVLLGENTELTNDLIDRIRGMDLDGVYIHGMSRPSVPIEAMLSELDERFRAIESEPYMDVLKRLLKEHIESLYG
jgi:hypothetical protein